MADHPRLLSKLYSGLAYVMLQRGAYDAAIDYGQRAARIFLQIGDLRGRSQMLNQLGIAHRKNGDNREALEYMHRALNLQGRLGDSTAIARTHNNLGNIYTDAYNFPRAFNHYLQARDIHIAQQNHHRSVEVLINIGLMYMRRKTYSEAIPYYRQALRQYDTAHYGQQAHLFKALGDYYVQVDSIQAAQHFLERALASARLVKDQERQASILLSLGRAYFVSQNVDSLISILQRAGDKAESQQRRDLQSKTLLLLARALKKAGRYREAGGYIEQAYGLALQDSNPRVQSEVLAEQAEYYFQRSRFEEAYAAQRKHDALQDSLMAMDRREEAQQIYARYIAEQQEREVHQLQAEKELLEQQQEIRALKLRQRNLMLLGTGTLSVLLLGGGVLLWRNYRRSLEYNVALNELVELRSRELQRTSEALEKTNYELDEFLYHASHDLRGPMTTMQSLINYNQEIKDEVDMDQFFNNFQSVLNRSLRINDDIIDVSNLRHTDAPLAFEPAQPLFEGWVSRQQRFCQESDARLHANVSVDQIMLRTNKGLLYRLLEILIENAVMNAVYHRDQPLPAQIFFDAYYDRDLFQVVVQVRDDGLGLAEGMEDKLFRIFKRGTARYPGTGLGLFKAQIIAERLDIQVRYAGRCDGYTIFEVVMPLEQPRESALKLKKLRS